MIMSIPETKPHQYINKHSFRNKVGRLLWQFVYYFLFRPTPSCMNTWRIMLLRCFGANIENAQVHASVRVWAPWKLEIGNHVFIDRNVNIYNIFGLIIKDRSIISQGSFICGGSHDYTNTFYPLSGGCVTINSDTWVAADVFIGPGVTIDTGCVVGARSVVTKNSAPWTVLAGNPAKVVKKRKLIS